MKKKLCALLFGLCLVSLTACGNKVVSDNAPASSQEEEMTENQDDKKNGDSDQDELEKLEDSDQEESSDDASEEDATTEDAGANEELIDGMRPEFKEAMDSYEEFYDEYCEVLKKYNANPSDMEVLVSYTDMLTKAVEVSEKFEAWEDNEMNDAELKYYMDVMNRVSKKLLELQ